MNRLRKNPAPMLVLMLAWLVGGCAVSNPCSHCEPGEDIGSDRQGAQFLIRQHYNPAQCAGPAIQPRAPADKTAGRNTRAVPRVPLATLQTGRLQVIKGSMQPRHAVLLVGGINDTYRYFDNWVATLAGTDGIVLGWNHEHRSMKMAASAAMLAQDLDRLRLIGMPEVTIVAHSIGGLIAKGAIDELSRNGKAHAFTRLDLHAFGSPWGGFAILKFTLKIPGSAVVSRLLGYPMAYELKPGSSYLASLSRPMPENGAMHLYVGNADNIALPGRSVTRRHYASVEAHAATITLIEGATHDDYNQAAALAQDVRQLTAQKCSGSACMPTAANSQQCAEYAAAVMQGTQPQAAGVIARSAAVPGQ